MSTPLLSTKLFFPRLRSNLVSRPRLVEKLDRGLRGPMTLISAPAGFGKTTLVSEWRTSHDAHYLPLAWLSLDEDDNDLRRFLIYMISAVATTKPGFGEIALAALQAHQAPPVFTFEYRVQRNSDGKFVVLDMPVYIP